MNACLFTRWKGGTWENNTFDREVAMGITRRSFLKVNTAVSLGVALHPIQAGMGDPRVNKRPLRIGVVGTGNRGRSLMRILLEFDDVRRRKILLKAVNVFYTCAAPAVN